MITAASVKQRARELGFDVCGIAPADAPPGLERIHEWIARGYAGDMGYLPRTAARRADVRRVLSSARAVIVAGTLYNADRPYSVEIDDPRRAIVARYAWGDDYHEVIGRRLEALLEWMRCEHGSPFEAVTCVDTGPVNERGYAERAGIGWVGKNGCLINPAMGSWLFLSEVVCSLSFEPDAPALDQCGTCTLCLEACPTGALVAPQVLDARRCLSYLTIELRRGIPEALRERLGTRVYGCDICQDVCPWNQAAPRSADPAWLPRPDLDAPRLIDLWRRTDQGLERLVQGSAMRRATTPGLRRNLALALGNSSDPASREALADRAGAAASPSLQDPMVTEHVSWALDGPRRSPGGRRRIE